MSDALKGADTLTKESEFTRFHQQSDRMHPPEQCESQNFLPSEKLEISQENAYRAEDPKYPDFTEYISKFISSQRLCVTYSIQSKSDQRLSTFF